MYTWGILHIINAGFLAVILIAHFRYTKKDFAANRLFSLLVLSLCYSSFLMFLFSTKWILDFPQLCRTGTFAQYLVYPATFLYVRKLLKQEGWKRHDLLHLLPALLYLIDFLPYFLQDAGIKRHQLELDYAMQNVYVVKTSWLFPKFFHFRFRILLSIGYLAATAYTWIRVFLLSEQEEIKAENRSVMQWTLSLCLLFGLSAIPSSIVYLFRIPIPLDTIQNGSMYATTICFALFLFFRPDIIYGIRGLWVAQPVLPSSDEEKTTSNEAILTVPQEIEIESSNKKIYLKEETVEKLATAIQEQLLNDKAYLRNSFSIADLSHAVGYPIHQVSAYLNNHLGMNFNEYINHQRINYLLKQLSDRPDWQMFTLEALGQKVGFNNRYTFLNAFKKVTGETPSIYLKKLRTA